MTTISRHKPNERWPGQKHAEAFALMKYRCDGPTVHEELIWNSRDGVTPFCITCPECAAEMRHVEWTADRYFPDYKPEPGALYFRNGTPDEAEAIVRSRIESTRGTEYEKYYSPEKVEEMITSARQGGGDFAPGWPKLDRFPDSPPLYCYSTDCETFYEKKGSRAAALLSALRELTSFPAVTENPEAFPVTTGVVIPVTLESLVNVEALLDEVSEQAADFADDFSEDFCAELGGLPAESRDLLRAKIVETLRELVGEPGFFTVGEVVEHTGYEDLSK